MPISFFVPAELADGLALREQRSHSTSNGFAPTAWVPRFPNLEEREFGVSVFQNHEV